MESISPQIIHVHGKEADIVLAADDIMRKAEERSRDMEQETGLAVAMDIFEDSKDAAIVASYDALTFQYQNTMDLSIPPILYARPAPDAKYPRSGSPELPSVVPYYELQRRASNPTNMDLEQFLLARVELRRCGETVYKYDTGYYRRLSGVDLRTLIHKLLRLCLNLQHL